MVDVPYTEFLTDQHPKHNTFAEESQDEPKTVLRRLKRILLKENQSTENLSALAVFEPTTFKQDISCEEKEKFEEAMNEEVDSIEKNHTSLLIFRLTGKQSAVNGCTRLRKTKLVNRVDIKLALLLKVSLKNMALTMTKCLRLWQGRQLSEFFFQYPARRNFVLDNLTLKWGFSIEI